MADNNNSNNNPTQLPDKPSSSRIRTRSHYNVSAAGAFRVVFLIILLVCFFRILSGNSTLSFASFFEMLQNCPQISTSWISTLQSLHVTLPVGFKWLQPVFDFFGDLSTLIMFFAVALLNVIPFVLYFLRWLIL